MQRQKENVRKSGKRKKYIRKLGEKSEKGFRLFPFLYRSETKTESLYGFDVLSFNQGRNKKIIYLHGGAYCEPPMLPHYLLCDRIASKTDYEVIFPVYKRAPNHTFKETYLFLEKLYRDLLETISAEDIILMGDSAGGGLALSFSEYLHETGLPQPSRIIAISPWVDVSMNTPFDQAVDKLDPNLQPDFLRDAGRYWAGDADVHDYRVSPIYGNLSALAPMTVYYGTHESLITEARIFRENCKQAGANLDYHEYEGMNHDFVLYSIPEAAEVQNEIISFLKQ